MISDERLERLARWRARSGAEQNYDASTGCECPDSSHCNVMHDLVLDVGALLDDVWRCHGALDRITEVVDQVSRTCLDTEGTAAEVKSVLLTHGVLDRPSEPHLAGWTP